jgi:hypothetical protein
MVNNVTMTNLSNFSHTNFVTSSSAYPFASAPTHVSLYAIEGLRFDACNFTNNNFTIANPALSGTGIMANDASFYVYLL